jgi:O-succinylbenzoate synthase
VRSSRTRGHWAPPGTLYQLVGQPLRRLPRAASSSTPLSAAREGLRIVLMPTGQAFGPRNLLWSEAWPLPGWSQETVPDLENLLRQLPHARPLLQWWSLAAETSLPPSLGWALSAACWRAHHPPHAVERRTARLLSGSPEGVLAGIAACAEPPSVVKVKITGWDPADVLWLCSAVRQLWSNLRLRLDANQSWQTQHVLEVMQHPASRCIAYWEEPTAEQSLMKLILAGVPVALDESLRTGRCDEALLRAAAAWIWKPTLSGSLERLFIIQRQARMLGKPLVLSSCFEGAHTVGLFMELSDPQVVHGLDPYHFHRADGPLLRRGSKILWKPG